jgi:hypothetical protein
LLALERDHTPVEYLQKIAMPNTLIDTFDDDERPTPPAESVAAPPVSLAFNPRVGGAGSGSGCAG